MSLSEQDGQASSSGSSTVGQSLTPTEDTSLLFSQQTNGYNTLQSLDDQSGDCDIEPNEFEALVAQSDSFNPHLGIEPASLETAMLRGPRKYRRGSIASSFVENGRGKSCASIVGHENAIEDEEDVGKSYFGTPQFWFIFGGILVMYFVACFDSTIMVSSHPIITSYFQSSNSASWLSTAFLLTSTAFQPLFGRLSDSIGRRSPYLFTTAIFFIGTVWCGAANSMLSFIFARAFCGLGAGGMMTMASIIVSDLVPIEVRGTYQSYINMLFGLGSTSGAALGGAIADEFGWRWEFYCQLPAIGICLVVAYFTVPADLGITKGAPRKSLLEAMKVFDHKGSFLLTTSITFLILGLNLGGNVYPWSHPYVITSLVIFSIAFPLFIYVESRVPLPIMPLRIVTHNPRAGIILSNFFGAIFSNAVLFNIPLFFQAVLLESATESGLRLMVPSITAASFGTLAGFWITWTKQLKVFIVAGGIFSLIGTVGLLFMGKDMASWAYTLFLIPTSIGTGFLFPSAFIAILAVSEQAEQAVVTSTLILWRSIGVVLGVAISSLVLQNALQNFLEEMVIGPDKEAIIQKVRKSVKSIACLEQPYKEQVIDAYAASLRLTFLTAVILAVVTLAVVLPLRLPKLGQRKK